MESNIWRRFDNLLQPPPEEVVVITGNVADGMVSAKTLSNSTVRLRCAIEISIGDHAIASGGVVRTKVPALPYYELTI